jgi:AraC-like DNA-binding protein
VWPKIARLCSKSPDCIRRSSAITISLFTTGSPYSRSELNEGKKVGLTSAADNTVGLGNDGSGNDEAEPSDMLAADDIVAEMGSSNPPTGLSRAKLNRAIAYITAHLSEDIKIVDIAAHLGISQYHFGRLFKQSTGITVHNYLIQQRVKRAQQLLRESDLTILVIAEQCGFANPSHLARCFRKQLGVTPRQFRAMS